MGVVAAYDMYKECCEGFLDSNWKIDEKERMSYSEFCMKLSMLEEFDSRACPYSNASVDRAGTPNPSSK